ncbi:MAG: ABC transporter ATP-binding protein [Chthoniobacterales bacterium]|nr:ABC transporter ATP-binding protein [Chthoniobacterales bacterium]
MSLPAVCFRNVTKVFSVPFRREKIVAVSNLSFEVAAGQVYGLLGPNGSGKSTTLKILLGLIRPSQGSSEIFGKDSQSIESRSKTGYLPENPYYYKFLTAQEVLEFYGKLSGLGGRKLKQRVEELLELAGLIYARNRRVGSFSKGMLQRVGLAQALLGDPQLVVLDEPTAGVDPAGSKQIRDLILELKRRGKTVLLTSHLLEQVQEVCDRVGILARGKLVREGPLSELVSIKNQTEFIIEGAGEELCSEIRKLISQAGAKLVVERQPQESLEKIFLDSTL